jgi:hypothetical protein
MFCSCATGGGYSRLTAAAVRKVIYRPVMNELKQGWEERWGEKEARRKGVRDATGPPRSSGEAARRVSVFDHPGRLMLLPTFTTEYCLFSGVRVRCEYKAPRRIIQLATLKVGRLYEAAVRCCGIVKGDPNTDDEPDGAAPPG